MNRFGGFQNFALMHLFAANGAAWIRHFLWESAMNWEYAFHLKHNSSVNWSKNTLNFTVHSLESDLMSEDTLKHYPNHVVHCKSAIFSVFLIYFKLYRRQNLLRI